MVSSRKATPNILNLVILNKYYDRISIYSFRFIHPSQPESTSSLLVHLRPWRHTIHRHEENLARLDDPEEHLQVMEDVCKNLFLRNAKVDIFIVWVRTLVDDAVHVQIEVVKLWNLTKTN